jgi:hypothetical protein
MPPLCGCGLLFFCDCAFPGGLRFYRSLFSACGLAYSTASSFLHLRFLRFTATELSSAVRKASLPVLHLNLHVSA